MCGIAGIIHRDGPGDIGAEITAMLQSMKHRGPDSSGIWTDRRCYLTGFRRCAITPPRCPA